MINYAILAKTGISTVPTSAITGNIGVSPIAEAAMTGFSFTFDDTGTSSTQITGKAFAASYGGTIETALNISVSDMETAYTNAEGRDAAVGSRLDYGDGNLGGAFGGDGFELTTGVYTFGSNVNIVGDIHFTGASTDVFIIQIAGNLLQAAAYNVILEGGVLPSNILSGRSRAMSRWAKERA
jgi:hypothetical protein